MGQNSICETAYRMETEFQKGDLVESTSGFKRYWRGLGVVSNVFPGRDGTDTFRVYWQRMKQFRDMKKIAIRAAHIKIT